MEGEHSNETETMEAQAETMQTEAIETDAKDMASGTETIPMESETESDSDALAIGYEGESESDPYPVPDLVPFLHGDEVHVFPRERRNH